MSAFLHDFGFLLCSGALLGAVFQSVAPSKRTGKLVRTVCGLFLVSVIAASLLHTDFAALGSEAAEEMSALTQTEETDGYRTLAAAAATKRAEEALLRLLTEKGVAARSVTLATHIGSGGDIYCDKAEVLLESGAGPQEDAVRQIVEAQCGVVPEIRYES